MLAHGWAPSWKKLPQALNRNIIWYADLCMIPLKKEPNHSRIAEHISQDAVAATIACTDNAEWRTPGQSPKVLIGNSQPLRLRSSQ